MKKIISFLFIFTCLIISTVTAFADIAPETFRLSITSMILAVIAAAAAIILIVVPILHKFLRK